jgi:hypothetical protein
VCCPCLGGGVLFEASGHDAVELLMLAPVCHHLVGVRAVVVALQAVEVARALLIRACAQTEDIQLAQSYQQAAEKRVQIQGMALYNVHIRTCIPLTSDLLNVNL